MTSKIRPLEKSEILVLNGEESLDWVHSDSNNQLMIDTSNLKSQNLEDPVLGIAWAFKIKIKS